MTLEGVTGHGELLAVVRFDGDGVVIGKTVEDATT